MMFIAKSPKNNVVEDENTTDRDDCYNYRCS